MRRRRVEPFYELLGSKIQKTRENRGMTQAELGRRLNPPATRASIANVENGQQRVLAHTLAQLATSLEVDIRELIPPPVRMGPALIPKEVEKELQEKLGLDPPPALKELTASLASKDRS